MSNLLDEIKTALNRASAENGSDTPDFILAEYLTDCLAAWDKGVRRREEWYGRAVRARKDMTGVPVEGFRGCLDVPTFRSNAQWPEAVTGLNNTDNVTTDTHATRSGAEGTCRVLQLQGLGGDGKIFPLKVWVDEIPPGKKSSEVPIVIPPQGL